MIKHASFYFSCCYNREIESMGVTEHTLLKSQLLKFYLLFVRVYRGKKLQLLKFSSNFYEISHDDSKDIIRTHNYGYFAFRAKMLFLDKNNFIFKNYRSFTETTVLGTQNILWKFELHQSIFFRFHMYWKFKIQRNKSEWCKTFLSIYFRRFRTNLTYFHSMTYFTGTYIHSRGCVQRQN